MRPAEHAHTKRNLTEKNRLLHFPLNLLSFYRKLDGLCCADNATKPIRNTVVEYKKNELIAWRHLGRWRWRYELTDLGNGSTQVTESFDGTHAPAIAQVWLNFRKAYPWTQLAVAKTLVRLKAVAEAS